MQRAIGTFLMSVTLTAAWPAVAEAQALLMSCKTFSATPQPLQAPLATDADPKTPRPYIAKGIPDSPTPYVELVCDAVHLFADEVEVYREQHVLKARGHVAFIDGKQRVTADRMEFNTQTKLGSFWGAQGIMAISSTPNPRSMLGSTEADAYFFGERIDKTGPDTYRFSNGTFTTCVQPTPRWELSATRMVLVKDRRAVMRNAVLRVKNVPILYLPYFYYPITKDGRSTGFTMPSYGSSTLRGQMFSSAFFWAINRSQDATVSYDYSSKAGQGYGGEYRYVQAPGSTGSVRTSVFNGKSGEPTALFTSRTYQIAGEMTQRLPARLELRGVVDYFSDVRTQQLQQNLNASTNSQRAAEFNLRGARGRVLLDAEAGFRDVFYNTTQGSRIGSLPRVGLTFSQSPIGRSKIYFGAASEFSALIRQDKLGDPTTSRNLARFDFNPVVRAPIGQLPFLAIGTTAGFRFTTWSQQLDAKGVQQAGALHRQLLDLRADVTGPTFTKIFDTPGNRYATRWKHVIQPTFSIQKTTIFEDFAKVPKNDSIDNLVGGVTSMSYGLANRLLAKRPTPSGTPVAQEIASIQLQQTYYSNAAAAFYDTSYQSSSSANSISQFSPVSLTASVQPTPSANVSMRMEYDTKFHAVRSTSVGAGVTAPLFNASANWSKQDQLSASATGVTIKTAGYQALNTSASVRTLDRRFSGMWAWSYDVQRKQQLQQRFTASYMAQCCGIAMEYQIYNLRGLQLSGVQQDKRFNVTFSLAGIGTFTNLLGAFGR